MSAGGDGVFEAGGVGLEGHVFAVDGGEVGHLADVVGGLEQGDGPAERGVGAGIVFHGGIDASHGREHLGLFFLVAGAAGEVYCAAAGGDGFFVLALTFQHAGEQDSGLEAASGVVADGVVGEEAAHALFILGVCAFDFVAHRPQDVHFVGGDVGGDFALLGAVEQVQAAVGMLDVELADSLLGEHVTRGRGIGNSGEEAAEEHRRQDTIY